MAFIYNFFPLETLITGYDEIFYSKVVTHSPIAFQEVTVQRLYQSIDRERNSQRLYISCIYFKNRREDGITDEQAIESVKQWMRLNISLHAKFLRDFFNRHKILNAKFKWSLIRFRIGTFFPPCITLQFLMGPVANSPFAHRIKRPWCSVYRLRAILTQIHSSNNRIRQQKLSCFLQSSLGVIILRSVNDVVPSLGEAPTQCCII